MRRTHILATVVATILVVAAVPVPADALTTAPGSNDAVAFDVDETQSVSSANQNALRSGDVAEHGSAGSETQSRNVADASGSFPGGNVTVTRGDRVTFTVSHSGPANVTIGGPDYGYHLRIHLGGSGTDEVSIDTYATTSADPDTYVTGGDATLVGPSGGLDEPLEPGDYLVRVDVAGVERDIATLTVEPRGGMSAQTFVAPGEFDPNSVNAGNDGNANVGPLTGVASARGTVAKGDYAVVKIEESGLETALNASDLSGGEAANGVKLTFTQTAPGPNRDPTTYLAHGTTDGAKEANVTVYPAFGSDHVYVVWDTSNVSLSRQSERNRYEARLTLTEGNSLVDEETVVAATPVRLVRQTVSLSPETDHVHLPWENDTYVVSGRTNRAPNTTLEVRIRSPDPNAFLQIRPMTVDGDGRFRASFDLGDVSRGANATMWVRDHYLETMQEVAIVAPDPSVTIDDQDPGDDPELTVARAEVPEGGFVRLVDEGGTAVGRSNYLEPGRHENVSASLSMPLYDSQTIRAELVADRTATRRTTPGTTLRTSETAPR
ncbi:BGTF surface domain-containing protein [Halopelagius fulvigenes]|uniref:BGTF surface domain-containing protein n=1 Tax=Halopelagius fulvigenes TaxID=1198324 RepID=A0ABD5U0B6_9EURY